METNILLESGTNELEILEFTVGGNSYGINVAKIREILPYKQPTPIPNAHPLIEGIFMPRDKIITIVNLSKCLTGQSKMDVTADMYIVTNFNQHSRMTRRAAGYRIRKNLILPETRARRRRKAERSLRAAEKQARRTMRCRKKSGNGGSGSRDMRRIRKPDT